MNPRILRTFPAICLFAALASFVAFHFSPLVINDGAWGWHFWEGVWSMLKRPEALIRRPIDAIIVAAFLTTTLLVPSSLILLPVLRKSRLAWLVLLIASLLAGLGLWIPAHIFAPRHVEMGFWFLFLANPLNFLGLATARLGIRPAQDPHGFAGNREPEILPESGNPENLPQ